MKLRLLAVVSAVALSLAACGGDDPAPADEATEGDSTPLVQMNPLTGLELPDGAPANPVFVVKVENTRAGAPQYGLNQADLVVGQLVEGGVTRLAAFYYTALPTQVGHVRSMRGTDIGIAAPVAGQLVATGGAPPTVDQVAAAGIPVFSEDGGAPGFSTDSSKSRPYNRLVDLTAVAAAATATDIPGPYLDFTPAEGEEAEGAEEPAEAEGSAGTTAAPPATRTVSSASVQFSRSTTHTWAFGNGVWSRTNGFAAEGQDFAATTLIVVFAPVQSAGYLDPGGNDVPETVFQGGGRALILAGDQAQDVSWAKDGLGGRLTFTDAAGAPVTIDPGKIWIELVPESGSATAQ
ncbi:hypothetical protein HMPREF0063_11849 [Aeromicrobium marinum DSM 15272]|uniref:DUF3048 domain-containing protein n=1 Tax=Aeromicrobium marinum DSM 15272 TaxID=585531 RepID=E2SDR3_9ACTN|nr:DUF3048 domain-containing protein [Aeromicrobium marinum]EFQ82640.1 hypothetical protein HMPREF0063_11849 [Aeromicrobium marinum DSM 15272]